MSYAVTYAYKRHMAWYRDFRPSDWPLTLKDGRLHPCVTMNLGFQTFFRDNFARASMAERYRAWFSFAATMCHELTHAYHYWLTGNTDEPLFEADEKNPELGFSWESHVIGLIPDLLHPELMAHGGRFKCLIASKVERLQSLEDVQQKYEMTRKANDTLFTSLWLEIRAPLLKPAEFLGNLLWLAKESDANFIASIHAIPVTRIMHWFQHEEWTRTRREWKDAKSYIVPPLGKTFMVTYARREREAAVHRSLRPEVPYDARLIESGEVV
jgi:hypothetical protein